jgi:hypothetical protein
VGVGLPVFPLLSLALLKNGIHAIFKLWVFPVSALAGAIHAAIYVRLRFFNIFIRESGLIPRHKPCLCALLRLN